jgi:hypothetical protein
VGHKRLLRLPATRKWQQVVELLARGAELERIAAAAAEAAEHGLPIASRDPALVRAFWLLTQIPLAARGQPFEEGLRRVGIDVGAQPSLVELVGALTEAVDRHVGRIGGRTDLGEMAQLAAAESLSSIAGRELPGLFGATPQDVKLDQIAASMVEFGWTNPVLVDEQGGILAGHGRLLAAQSLGLAEVPVVRFEHLSEVQKRAYILADNQIALQAGLHDACVNILQVTKGAVYICMSSSELDTLQKAFRRAGGKWSTFIIWAKNTFTLGRADYQRQYEPILYGWREGSDHYWCGARDQGDVWFFDKPARNDLHPTMKPVALVQRAIRNSSKSRDIVLDPFGGSGSTLIACEKAGRQARLIELDPKYVDVIIQRWQAYSGGAAVLEGEGRAFSQLAGERTAVPG